HTPCAQYAGAGAVHAALRLSDTGISWSSKRHTNCAGTCSAHGNRAPGRSWRPSLGHGGGHYQNDTHSLNERKYFYIPIILIQRQPVRKAVSGFWVCALVSAVFVDISHAM